MMAISTLHYILFSITRVANPHLLLDESFQVLWARPRVFRSVSDTEGNGTTFQQHSINLNEFSDNNKTKVAAREKLVINQDGAASPLEEQYKFLYTHTILFIVFIATFLIGSVKTLQRVDLVGHQRSHLTKMLIFVLIMHPIYLYTMNAIAADPSIIGSNRLIMCIQSVLVAFMIGGLQGAQATIGSIGDVLIACHDIRDPEGSNNKSATIHNQFIANLIIGSVSFVAASLSLGEIFITNPFAYEHELGFSDLALAITLVAFALELICLELFTSSYKPTISSDVHFKGQNYGRYYEPTFTWFVLPIPVPKTISSLNYGYGEKSRAKKSVYSMSVDNNLNDMPRSALSISARNMHYSGEVSRSIDEDEFNEVDLYDVKNSFQEEKESEKSVKTTTTEINQEMTDFYDRDKFSLYEDFDLDTLEPIPCEIPTNNALEIIIPVSKEQDNKCTLSSIEILLLEERSSFIQQIILLILIGCIYQANQLCYLTDYLHFLNEKLPLHFRNGLPIETNLSQLHGRQSLFIQNSQVLWMELVCVSLLAQTITRIACLCYSSFLVIKFGHEKILLTLALISLSIPVQFAINYNMIMCPNLGLGRFVASIVIAQLVLIQLQVGFIGALVDFIINDLALKYAQNVANYHSTNRTIGHQSAHCTIHGLLSGSFYLVGGALMSTISLLANFFTLAPRDLSTWIALASLTPASILLALISSLFAYHARSQSTC